MVQEGVLVVKAVQYEMRQHSTCSVEKMPLALELRGDIEGRIGKAGSPKKSAVGRDCNAAAKTAKFFEDALQITGIIQSGHSRRRVPISLS